MEKKEYIVTVQGSLGLLALGHIGVSKWREAINNKKKVESKETNASIKKDGKK